MREELFEIPKGRSETIPNQALRISDLMNRSAMLRSVPYFPDSGDENDDDLGADQLDDVEDRFDAMDRLSYLEARHLEQKRLKEQAEKEKQAKQTQPPQVVPESESKVD